MSLVQYTASQQQMLRMFSFGFGSAISNDLISLGASLLDQGMSTGDLCDRFLGLAPVRAAFPGYETASNTEFVRSVLTIAAHGAGVSAGVIDGWATALAPYLGIGGLETRGRFVTVLSNLVYGYAGTSGGDANLTAMGNVMYNRMLLSADYAQTAGGQTYMGFQPLMDQVAAVTPTPVSVMELAIAQDSVFMRGTSLGYIYSQSYVELKLPQPLKITDLQNMSHYSASDGVFGSGATVVSMQQAGDPVDCTSNVMITFGNGATFTPGTTHISLTANDSAGISRHYGFDMPQIWLQGTAGSDVLQSTRNEELIDLRPGGADRVVLNVPSYDAVIGNLQGADWISGFTPGVSANADVLDLRAFSLTGIRDSQPGIAGIQADSTTSTEGADISNQLVLIKNVGPMFSMVSSVEALFGLGKPFMMAANSRAVIILFEVNDNREDIYYVANDSNQEVRAETWDMGQLILNGVYSPGNGTYVDGSFAESNFLF